MPSETSQNDIETVFAMEGLKLTQKAAPSPEPILEPEQEAAIEQIEAIFAVEEAEDIARLECIVACLENELAETEARNASLIRNNEFVLSLTVPEIIKPYYEALSAEEQDAFVARMHEQAMALREGRATVNDPEFQRLFDARVSPKFPGGDGKLIEPVPVAGRILEIKGGQDA